MAAEFVLVNPGGRRRRRRTPPRDPRTGAFLSSKRRNPKGHGKKHGGKRRGKRGATVTVRTNPGPAALPAAMTAADLVMVPAAALAGNPGKRRRRPSGGRRSFFFGPRRNPADGPVDFVQQAVPVGFGVWAADMLDRLPWIGHMLRSPLGKLVFAYVLNQWGPRIFGAWAEPISYGIAIRAGLQMTQGASLMGDVMEGNEADAIHAVELDGVAGYFVPEGLEGAFSGPARRRLPAIRGQGGGGRGDWRRELEPPPPGFPPRLWAEIPSHKRPDIVAALRGPDHDAVLQRFVAVARQKGLLGELEDFSGAADDVARELAAG